MSGHQASTQPGTASGEEEETCPPTVAAGTPAQMQGTAAGSLPPLATVVHTSYAPAPATGERERTTQIKSPPQKKITAGMVNPRLPV